jgi:hypothetical protein
MEYYTKNKDINLLAENLLDQINPEKMYNI